MYTARQTFPTTPKRGSDTMAHKISRRSLFAGAVTAGFAAHSLPKAVAQAPQRSRAAKLPDVWGQDFLYQWSPPDNVKRDLTPGNSAIRLSHIQMTSAEGTDYGALFKRMRAEGWTACEVGSAQWLSRKLKDSEVRDIKTQLKAHDVNFYGIHCAVNIIAPDPEADRW